MEIDMYNKLVTQLLLAVAELMLDHQHMLSNEQEGALRQVRKLFATDYRS